MCSSLTRDLCSIYLTFFVLQTGAAPVRGAPGSPPHHHHPIPWFVRDVLQKRPTSDPQPLTHPSSFFFYGSDPTPRTTIHTHYMIWALTDRTPPTATHTD